jgi:Fic family protein
MEQPSLDRYLAERLAAKKARLDAQRPLAPELLRRLADDLRLLLTFHSNAIEGNTLSLRETKLVIEDGITVGGKTLREHLEATNHAEAVSAILELADTRTPITTDTIRWLHTLVMDKILPTAGQFRSVSVVIRGANFTPPHPTEIPALIEQWVGWIGEDGPGAAYDPVTRAAIAHHGFEAVHPFEDGNGRVGRLLLNLMLLRGGYPPAIIKNEWRLVYLEALDRANLGRYAPIVNLIGRAVESGLDFYLESLEAVPRDEYRTLEELSLLSGYSSGYLARLARSGKLAAIKRGGRWYSTDAAIDHYRRSRGS